MRTVPVLLSDGWRAYVRSDCKTHSRHGRFTPPRTTLRLRRGRGRRDHPTPPSAPTGVTATAGSTQVTISWTAVSNATSYNIYWSTTTGVTTTTGTKIPEANSPYIQTGLAMGTTYYYVLTALDAVGESAASPQVSATICPTGMATVSIPEGGTFCIDQVEVTNAAYSLFTATNPSTATQSASCSWNTSWTPFGGWPYGSGNANVPVSFVNWCQASAFCSFAGKHLCGRIGGGSLTLVNFSDASEDQWFSACTNNGGTCSAAGCYPYGGIYQSAECNGVDAKSGTALSWQSWLSCAGGVPGLLDMSGNVAEWEDACSAANGAGDSCAIRGGSFLDSADRLRCDSGQTTLPITQPRNYVGPDVGFRCCL